MSRFQYILHRLSNLFSKPVSYLKPRWTDILFKAKLIIKALPMIIFPHQCHEDQDLGVLGLEDLLLLPRVIVLRVNNLGCHGWRWLSIMIIIMIMLIPMITELPASAASLSRILWRRYLASSSFSSGLRPGNYIYFLNQFFPMKSFYLSRLIINDHLVRWPGQSHGGQPLVAGLPTYNIYWLLWVCGMLFWITSSYSPIFGRGCKKSSEVCLQFSLWKVLLQYGNTIFWQKITCLASLHFCENLNYKKPALGHGGHRSS